MQNKAQTIITAAGKSQGNFQRAGFPVPKNLIVVDKAPLIEGAIESYTHDPKHLFVAINQDELGSDEVREFLRSKYPEAKICPVPDTSMGALASALHCFQDVDLDSPLILATGDSICTHNLDKVLEDFIARGIDAGTVVFRSSGDRWSYVLPGDENRALEVSEKFQISDLATIGYFYFRSAGMFKEMTESALLDNSKVAGSFYVSTVLNYLIKSGLNVRFYEINADEYWQYSLPYDFVKGGLKTWQVKKKGL